MAKIYIDVCCWNRPLDDQTQTRVHLEAEAVLAILSEIERGGLQLLHSEVVELEISNVPDAERRERLQALIPREHTTFCVRNPSWHAHWSWNSAAFPASMRCIWLPPNRRKRRYF